MEEDPEKAPPRPHEFGGYSKAWIGGKGNQDHEMFDMASISRAIGMDVDKEARRLIIEKSPSRAKFLAKENSKQASTK